ncbi:MAG: site-specific DNA-methyltransferase [Candidatus Heimdallarchaeota archaeon]|nr:site-specific DNA-methyltransferase [Candidatus Heimdallarchaeota archaeon]
MDWTKLEAKNEYLQKNFEFKVDLISYDDCIEGMKALPDESVNMVLADPPFGIEFHKMETMYNRKSENVVEGYQEVKIENYDQFTFEWIKEIPRIMKEDAGAWIFSGWTNLKDILFALEMNNLSVVNHIIWKYQFGVFTKRKFVSSHYHILFAVKNKKKYFFNKIEHYPEDVWIINRKYMPGIKKNATKLPTNVVLRCIDFGSRPGDLIFDPFMGNGTTATASKGSFRHFMGFEMNKDLKEIIEWNLNKVELGELYLPYSERFDSSVEKAKVKFNKKQKSQEKKENNEKKSELMDFI